MRKLLTLVACLLLAGPALAQTSQRGMVDHIPTASLPTCGAATPELFGYRLYDTTANSHLICDETAAGFIAATTATTPNFTADININDATPAVNFEDSDKGGTEDDNGIIQVNCLTGTTALNNEDCDMDFFVQAAGTAFASARIDTTDAGDTEFQMGDPLNLNLAVGAAYVSVSELGNIYQRSIAPYIYIHDNNDGDTTYEGAIALNCPTTDDCDMWFNVESTDQRWLTPLKIDTPDADTSSVQMGDPENTLGAGANYVNVTSAGQMTAVGDAGIDATNTSQMVWFCGELGAAADEFFGGPYLNTIYGSVDVAHDFASVACNALGDTDVAVSDNDLDPEQGYRVNGMMCRVSAAPGGADTVLTFVDDTVNTDVTCTIGAAETSCASTRGVWADVAADSQVAVSTLNGTDDESAQDFHCMVYVTWN